MFYYRIMGPKDADGMANNVEPVQTAPVQKLSDREQSELPRPIKISLECMYGPKSCILFAEKNSSVA